MNKNCFALSCALTMIIFAWISLCQAAEYKGIIVNAETDEPIENVILNMEWQQWCIPGYDKFLEAKETLTNKNGFFRIEGPSINTRSICQPEEYPSIIAYKAGYIAIRNLIWSKPNLLKLGFVEGENVVLRLVEVSSEESMKSATLGITGLFPIEYQKLLVNEINKERRRLKLKTVTGIAD